ncbi:Hypothetical protein GLP15_4254 [Giardia lamblia P15]|uniref:ATP synthase subunit E family protein n=1 Tax=Giardia intestinalis (strain P15) TaxID=658858 RepID=E1EY08_GIAIA|nr:Hypothetical protein GLP15_4254 [Giardia lamblia P15]
MNQKISNMVHFIDAETDRTIAQLRKVAEQTATVSYDQILNTDTSKVVTKVQEMRLTEEHKRQVEISRLVSKARLSVQDAQYKKYKDLRATCVKKLEEFTRNTAEYTKIMRTILSEAVECCNLTHASIQLLPRDAGVLTAISDQIPCKIVFDKQVLPDTAIGGFILRSEDGRVCIDCTLSERLEQGLKCMEPTIFKTLFPTTVSLWEG